MTYPHSTDTCTPYKVCTSLPLTCGPCCASFLALTVAAALRVYMRVLLTHIHFPSTHPPAAFFTGSHSVHFLLRQP